MRTLLAFALFAIAALALITGSAYAGKSNRRDVDATAIVSGADCDTSANTDTTVDTYDEVACQFVWSGANAVDATVAVHASVDGTNYEVLPASSYTLAAASGNHVWSITVAAMAKIRFAYAKGSNTTGTYSITCRKEVPTGSEN